MFLGLVAENTPNGRIDIQQAITTQPPLPSLLIARVENPSVQQRRTQRDDSHNSDDPKSAVSIKSFQ